MKTGQSSAAEGLAIVGEARARGVVRVVVTHAMFKPVHCILASDMGQPGNPLHPDALAAFFAALRRKGIPQNDIDLMSKTNPARALGLN